MVQFQQPTNSPVTTVNQQQAQINKEIVRFAGRTLTSGGQRIPLLEFTGTLQDWNVEQNQFRPEDADVVFNFVQVRVLRLRTDAGPYPYDTADLRIKFSQSERSGYGLAISSMDRSLGVPKDESNLDAYLGKVWHMNTIDFDWGPPSSTMENPNLAADGHVHSLVWQGAVVRTGNGAAQPNMIPTPAPAPVSQPAPAPVQAQVEVPQPAPAPVAPAAPATAPKSSLHQVYDLAHGSTRDELYRNVVNNEAIRADSTLLLSILQDTWLSGEIASGRITQDDQGILTVTVAH